MKTMIRMLKVRLVFAVCLMLPALAVGRDYSALVVEPESGRVLYEKFANEQRHPASITKIMTLYLVFEALERGDITLNTPLNISRNAVLRPPSRLGLTAGDTISVEDAILALVTRSANDAATVIAENLGGTEAGFASMMTAKARSLGMNGTVFQNASGLPDPDQWTTAWDMYRLGRAVIRDFPRYYPYFSTPRFYYRGQSFDNHNHLMETYSGMDGIKTGFINSSGFNLVASAKRGDKRLIGVVFGGPSAVRRDRHMRAILDDGFAQIDGAPAGNPVADFDRVSEPRPYRFAEAADVGAPEVTFASRNRSRRPPAAQPAAKTRATREAKPVSVRQAKKAVIRAEVRPAHRAAVVKPARAVAPAPKSAATPRCKGAVDKQGHCATAGKRGR